MFNIPQPMLSYWESKAYKKASIADLAGVERLFGAALPASYVEFVTQIGFVAFDSVPQMEMHNLFDYKVGSPEGTEIGEGNVAYFFQPEHIVKSHKILTEAHVEDDEDFPKFPRNYLPIGSDAGIGKVLMEIAEKPGRIWYWKESDWAWGTEDNTWLGFVANDFKDFINGLRP